MKFRKNHNYFRTFLFFFHNQFIFAYLMLKMTINKRLNEIEISSLNLKYILTFKCYFNQFCQLSSLLEMI